MMPSKDSLTVEKNDDGTFTLEWDRQDPNWTWLNDLTSEELEVIMEQAMKEYPYEE